MVCVSSWAGKPGRILVAESNPVTAGALAWLLRERGYAVTVVPRHDQVLASITDAAPDLILLDGGDVERDGTVLGLLRADARWQDVRVIVTAPFAALDNGSDGLPWGADDCVSKSFRVPELLGRVRTQIRASGELRDARASLRDTAAQLDRAREDAMSNRRLVDILHEVTGELSALEIYRILSQRVARALELSRCSVVLARPGDAIGTFAAAPDDATIHDVDLPLDSYPEIRTAIDTNRPVLVADARVHPLFAEVRKTRAAAGRPAERRPAAGRPLEVRSAAAVPFTIDQWRSGVLVLRTGPDERTLTTEDIHFSGIVLRAAVAAIRRAQALETTRADNRRLEALATTDPLTRVLNRRALRERLITEGDRARRYESSLSLLLIDIDHFKQINDTFGHLAGDSALRELGALLEEAVRTVDIVARYGGEEFVVILPETVTEGGVVFAERLRECVASRAFDVGTEHPVHLTVSIGVATFPSASVTSTEDLFARADEALYRAKSGGRNQVAT